MRRLKVLFVLSAFYLCSAEAATQPLSGNMTFDAVGKPSMIKIHGEGKQLTGQLNHEGNTLSGLFLLKLDDLDTGMKLRNEHMRKKYLEVEKYPDAKLKLDPLKIPSDQGSFKGVPFKGVLTLHGVEKPVDGLADISIDKTIKSVSAEFSTKVSDYGILIPSFAGVTMANEVIVKVRLEP
jgi:polyisoprenoid-binding protein YceI